MNTQVIPKTIAIAIQYNLKISLPQYFYKGVLEWQPTPVFLPGESQGRRSLVGCRPWGHTESDMTEAP